MNRVFISAGHTSMKPGACHEGFCEWQEANKWAMFIADKLGARAQLVPSTGLTKKINYINSAAKEIDICMEIHFNSHAFAYHGFEVHGAETLYYPGSEKGADLARKVQDAMVYFSGVNLADRGIKEGWYQQDKTNGVLYFLKKTKIPAIIIEPEFIQNRELIEKMRKNACIAIATALSEYLDELRLSCEAEYGE